MALHENGKRQDNRLKNLYWGFAQDNAEDRERHGNTARAETNGNAKLTWDKVRKIRSLETSESSPKLARQFGVSKKCILNIWRQKTWKEDASP